MLVKKIATAILIGGLAITMSGCSSNKKTASSGKWGSGSDTTRTAGVENIVEFYGEEISSSEEQDLLENKTVYFGFDKFELNQEGRRVILAHAREMLKNPTLKIRVDGHTDEKGSREYNIGLGERRAKAVARVLAEKGISSDRVVTVSYGKEKPFSLGHDEDSWSLNRRAEVEYEG